MVLGCVQKAIAFVMLCSLSEAAEESAVKWASCFKLPELMHFGRFFPQNFWSFKAALVLVGQRQRAGCFRNFSTRTYFILFHLMDSYGPYGYLSAFAKASKA